MTPTEGSFDYGSANAGRETFAGASARKKASADVVGIPVAIEHAAPQRKTASRTRGLKKADREIDFFCIVTGGCGLEPAFILDITAACQTFSYFFGFLSELRFCSGSRAGCLRMNYAGDTPALQ